MLNQQNDVITFLQIPIVLIGSFSFLKPYRILKDVLRRTNQFSGIFSTVARVVGLILQKSREHHFFSKFSFYFEIQAFTSEG